MVRCVRGTTGLFRGFQQDTTRNNLWLDHVTFPGKTKKQHKEATKSHLPSLPHPHSIILYSFGHSRTCFSRETTRFQHRDSVPVRPPASSDAATTNPTIILARPSSSSSSPPPSSILLLLPIRLQWFGNQSVDR